MHGLIDIYLLREDWAWVTAEVAQVAEGGHVNARFEHKEDVCRVMVRFLFCFGADVKACTVCTAEPDTTDLVGMNVAQRLAMQDMLEVPLWVVWTEYGCRRNHADPGLVKQR